jgi:hypothetical protein
MPGEPLLDALPQHGLDLPVGVGYQGAVLLREHSRRPGEVPQGDLVRLVGELKGKGERVGEFVAPDGGTQGKRG